MSKRQSLMTFLRASLSLVLLVSVASAQAEKARPQVKPTGPEQVPSLAPVPDNPAQAAPRAMSERKPLPAQPQESLGGGELSEPPSPSGPVPAIAVPAQETEPLESMVAPPRKPTNSVSEVAAQSLPSGDALLDPGVQRVQQAPAGAEPGAAVGGSPFVIAPENLPLAAQSVGLSIQVLAPASVNLNKESTVTIVVKNTTSSDARGVVVRDQLPEGMKFVSSQPETAPPVGSIVTWNLDTLPANSERQLKLVVLATAKGAQDHAATVQLVAGSRARSVVIQPELRAEQVVTRGTVLKGQQVGFDITVTNTGDGTARGVIVQAELSEGLSHKVLGRILVHELKELGPRQTVKLDTLMVDTVGGGDQSCTVTVSSPDMVGEFPDSRNEKTVTIVEPKLVMELTGSELRYTDSDAEYTITLTNPGTAPAMDVKVAATLLGDGRPYKPSDATWDASNRRLTWTIAQIDPNSAPRTYTFRVRLGGLGIFKVDAEAVAKGGLRDFKSASTSVEGDADVRIELTEDLRVLDVGQETIYHMKLTNTGTKEARQVLLNAQLSTSMEALETAGTDQNAVVDKQTRTQVTFPEIPRLAPGAEMVLAIRARAKSPGLATCRVYVSHADLKNFGDARIEAVATAKVTGGGGGAGTTAQAP